jgi:hypothetical protein
MHSYLLFLPNQSNQATALAAAGLSSIAGGERWFPQPSSPSNEPGLFCAWGDPRNPADDVAMVYDLSRQTWKRGPGGKWWIGVQNDKRPGPSDLARAKSINGHAVTLADGNEWVMPNVMALPAVFDLDDDGNEVKRTRAEWQDIEQRAGWALNVLAESAGGCQLPETECRRYVADMLCVNYRLAPEMVYLLGLLDSECWVTAMAATVDGKRLFALRQEIAAGESQARTS